MIVLKSLARAWIKRLAFAPSGTAVAAAAGGSGFLLWSELLNGKRAELLTLPFHEAADLAYTPDGGHLFCSGRSSSGAPLCAVRLATRDVTPFLIPTSNFRFALAPDSAQVIASEQRLHSGALAIRSTCWSLHKPDAPAWEVVDNLPFMFRPFFLSADRFLIVSVRDGKDLCLRTRSASTGELVSEAVGVSTSPDRVTLSPDATQLASVSGVFLHVQPVSDPFRARPVARNDNKKHFADFAYHPSGKYLATASNDETIKFFDTTTWEVVRTFTWKTGKMRAVCFSPDGTLAAAGGEKGQVVVWDVDL